MKPEIPFKKNPELDADIAPLVEVLRGHPSIATLGSCSGHGRESAYVDLAVKGLKGLRIFQNALCRVDAICEAQVLLDAALNWSRDVDTAMAPFDHWISLSLTVEGLAQPAPTAEELRQLATAFAEALR